MTRGTGNGSASITGLRQQLTPLYAILWHVGDKPGRGIAQQRPIYVLWHLDDTSPNWFLGSAGIHKLHIMRARMGGRDGISLNDARTSHRWHGVKVLCRKLRVGCVDRFRNWDHVGKACVH